MKTATLATLFAAALAQAQVQGIDGDAVRRLQQMARSYSDSIGQLRDEFTAFLNSNPGASGSLANDLAWKTVGVSDSIGRAQGQLADIVGTLDWALSTQQPGGGPGPAGGFGPVDQGPGAGAGPADNQGPGAGAGPVDQGPGAGAGPVDQGPGAGAGPADTQGPGAGAGPADNQGPGAGAGPVDQGPGAGAGPADTQGPGAGAGPADNQGPGAGAGPADNQGPGAGPGPAEGQGDDEGSNRKNVGAKFRRF